MDALSAAGPSSADRHERTSVGAVRQPGEAEAYERTRPRGRPEPRLAVAWPPMSLTEVPAPQGRAGAMN
jgi:hypothetical protein